jgi:histone deacetylase 1/2
MANGKGKRITSVGSNHFRSPTCPDSVLHLNNLLLVPALTKNLIIVSKFARDNNVFFEFHPYDCRVKSQDSSKVLLEVAVGKDGLYRFNLSLSNADSPTVKSPNFDTCFSQLNTAVNSVFTPSSYKLWHLHLGHPHHDALVNVLKRCNISVSNKTHSDFCNSCSIAKSHPLPSSTSHTQYNFPLELVFFDVWGPSSVESTCGFLYFLTCFDACTKFTWIFPLQKKSEVLSKV